MKRSRVTLLINEPPLQVLPSLAVQIGLNEAIVLQQLHYWINNPKTQGEVDPAGNKWVFNTYEEWRDTNFPFWSIRTVQRTFLNLEKNGFVLSMQPNASKRDHRKYYRIDYGQIDALDSANLALTDDANLARSITTDWHHPSISTETTSETTTETTAKRASAAASANKSNVFKLYEDNIGPLTPLVSDELKGLEQDYSAGWVGKAIHEAAMSNVRTIKYIKGVLRGYKERGGPEIGRTNVKQTGGAKSNKVDFKKLLGVDE